MSGWMGAAEDGLAGAVKGAAAGSIVPGIGTAAGGLIGLATALVPHVFGADAKPALRAAAEVVTGQTAEADQVTALTSDPGLTEQFRVQALQIAADREAARDTAVQNQIEAGLAGVANARATTVDLAGKGSAIAWGAPVVSLVVLVTFGLVVALALLRPLPVGSEAILNVLLGVLARDGDHVVGYWVGSSAGSAAKTDLLRQLGPGLDAAQTGHHRAFGGRAALAVALFRTNPLDLPMTARDQHALFVSLFTRMDTIMVNLTRLNAAIAKLEADHAAVEDSVARTDAATQADVDAAAARLEALAVPAAVAAEPAPAVPASSSLPGLVLGQSTLG